MKEKLKCADAMRNHSSKEGGSRCLVLMSVCLGLMCVLLLVFITLYITITAERDLLKSYKNTVEEFNHTINSLQGNYTGIMTDKDQLKNNLNSLSQKKPELETRVKDFSAEKTQLQTRVNSLSQEKSELQTKVNNLTAEQSQLETKVNNLTVEKTQLQTRVNNLTAEQSLLNQKRLELESNVTSLSEELKKEKSKQGNPRGPVCLFKSSELKSWSESRQFCRDHGGDLIIINTEEKQKHLTSFIKERVWIGLSEIENKGIMKWVDNSPLNQTFWFEDRWKPNNEGRNEDCVELMPLDSIQNWNDLSCSAKRKGICEKFGLLP